MKIKWSKYTGANKDYCHGTVNIHDTAKMNCSVCFCQGLGSWQLSVCLTIGPYGDQTDIIRKNYYGNSTTPVSAAKRKCKDLLEQMLDDLRSLEEYI